MKSIEFDPIWSILPNYSHSAQKRAKKFEQRIICWTIVTSLMSLRPSAEQPRLKKNVGRDIHRVSRRTSIGTHPSVHLDTRVGPGV